MLLRNPSPRPATPAELKHECTSSIYPFPQQRQLACLSPSAPNRAVSAQAYAEPLILFEQNLIIREKVLSSCLAQQRLSLVSSVTPVKSVLQAFSSDQR